MINRLFRTSSDFARQTAHQSAAWAVFVRDTASGFITTAHHMLLISGLVAIGLLAAMFFKPEIADRVVALSPFTAQSPASEPVQAQAELHAPGIAGLQPAVAQPAAVAAPALRTSGSSASAGNQQQQQWVTNWLSRRYRVAADATDMLVSAAYKTAREINLDPLLILSVMAIESRFNPFAESPVGAQGLMQVMSKVHRDKFENHGGVKAALDPVANIKVGSQILKEYVTRGGSVEAGLKLYVGAGAFDTDFGYGAKVLAEYRRLQDVAMGKKVSIYSRSASAPAKPQEQAPKAETPGVTPSATTQVEEADKLAAL